MHTSLKQDINQEARENQSKLSQKIINSRKYICKILPTK